MPKSPIQTWLDIWMSQMCDDLHNLVETIKNTVCKLFFYTRQHLLALGGSAGIACTQCREEIVLNVVFPDFTPGLRPIAACLHPLSSSYFLTMYYSIKATCAKNNQKKVYNKNVCHSRWGGMHYMSFWRANGKSFFIIWHLKVHEK